MVGVRIQGKRGPGCSVPFSCKLSRLMTVMSLCWPRMANIALYMVVGVKGGGGIRMSWIIFWTGEVSPGSDGGVVDGQEDLKITVLAEKVSAPGDLND